MTRGLVAVLCILSLILGGCWSRQELTEVSYASLIGLDRVDGQYLITLNVMFPRGGGGTGTYEADVWSVSSQAASIDEALSEIDQILPRALTLAHVRAIIFGETLAREGIWPVLDFLLRSADVRPNAWVGLTTGLAKDLLYVRSRVEELPVNTPLGFHEFGLRRTSRIPNRRLVEVAYTLLERGVDLSLPVFRRGSEPPPAANGAREADPRYSGELIFGGAGVFQGDRLVGWLSPDAARGELWVKNRVVHGSISATCPKNNGMIVFRLRDAESRFRVYQTGQGLRAIIHVEAAADVNELHCPDVNVPVADPEPLEALLSQAIRSEIEEALAVSRRTGSDFLGLGRQLYRWNPAAFRGQEQNWEAQLAKLPVEIQIAARVPRLGQINQRFPWRQPH